MFKYCLFVIFYIITAAVPAQVITIFDEISNEPVAGVAVYNSTKSIAMISNFEGKLDIGLFAKEELISFKHLSYSEITIKKERIKDFILLTPLSYDLGAIVISASKFKQKRNEVPQTIVSINSEDVKFSNPQTSADLMGHSGRLFVQKSQLGGGSPIIRGFATNRILISVDGVRMNNAIFRGGNLQNIISVDPFDIDNTEVILGSSSVLYGSDAIGGAINFYTKTPQLSMGDTPNTYAQATTRYSSANNENTANINFNLGYKKWAFRTNVSASKFGDLKMGSHGPDSYLRPSYVISQNGVDVQQLNPDPEVQKPSGFDQVMISQKAYRKMANGIDLNIGLHHATTSSFARYDRLICTDEFGELDCGEWNYGPQKWFMANINLQNNSSNSALYDKYKFITAYQNFKESRKSRRFGDENLKHRNENVNSVSTNLDFEKFVSEHSSLFYGLEFVYNKIGSRGVTKNISNGTIEAAPSRYPDGSTWQSLAAYLSYKKNIKSKLTVQTGLRYNYIVLDADLEANNAFYNLSFNKTKIETAAVTGFAGLSWLPSNKISWRLNASTAFRAPNIDDIGKIFDPMPGVVVMPNSNLKPEYSYELDLGVNMKLWDGIEADISSYYTYLDNALARAAYHLNGQEEIMYDDEVNEVHAIQNSSKAWIYGLEMGIRARLSNSLNFRSQYNITKGTKEELHGAETPVRHVPPNFGNTHLTWRSNNISLDAFADYSGSLKAVDISEEIAPYLFPLNEEGEPYSPSWYTLNLRSSYQLTSSAMLLLTLENITDQRYRPYSSGIAGPGRNFIAALNYRF